ncbi:MAG TPA: hypothetical protein VMY05_00385 [Acidobacteriota bacterium]|nr:hypothetical protein [Acidobacteriota bacterium]
MARLIALYRGQVVTKTLDRESIRKFAKTTHRFRAIVISVVVTHSIFPERATIA